MEIEVFAKSNGNVYGQKATFLLRKQGKIIGLLNLDINLTVKVTELNKCDNMSKNSSLSSKLAEFSEVK